MMGVALHSNVGLMHATMAIFNAWCDRVPMLILGATGHGCGAAQAWIDWIQPIGPGRAGARLHQVDTSRRRTAAYEALLARRADCQYRAARPTYVNLDAALQKRRSGRCRRCPTQAVIARRTLCPSPNDRRRAQLLSAAEHPVILAGRVARTGQAGNRASPRGEAASKRVDRPQGGRVVFLPTIRARRAARRPSCMTTPKIALREATWCCPWMDRHRRALKLAWATRRSAPR